MLKKSNYIISFFILIFAFQLNVFANVYYVDQSHVSANDGNVGSEEAPWATIMKAAATAQAGDTVFVKSGIYYDRIVFKNSGNDSAYITLKAYPNQTPEINGRDHAQWDGLINFSGVNYIRFEGFTVTNCSVGQAIYIINNGTSWATHIELKDLTISHIDDSGVQIRGNTSDVLIENCTAHDFNTASAFDASGYNGGRPNNITFRGNTVYNSSFAAVGSEMADDLLVENNNVSNCDIGLDIGSGKRNIIHNNSVVNCGDGIVLSSNSDSRVYKNHVDHANESMYAYYWSAHGEPEKNNKWYQNLVTNSNFGFFEMDRKSSSAATGPTTGHEYFNNVFYNVGGGTYNATFWFRGTDSIKFYNNTIYTRKILETPIFKLLNNAEDEVFKNNIVSLNGNKGLFDIEAGSSADIDYNCYFNRSGSVDKVGINDTVADPLFINPDSSDLHLRKTSPCIDAGIDMGLTIDFEDQNRPSGLGVDIGAYEYDPATSVLSHKDLISNYKLYQNYPNPFNPLTKISYSLPEAAFVILKIYDCLGREIRTMINERQAANTYSINFNGENLSSGVYYYRMYIGSNFVKTKKMLLIK